MIFIDTETTGLLSASANELSAQPHITEIGAVKVDTDMEFVDELHMLLNPQCEIPENIIKTTGITNEMVADKPIFAEVVNDLSKFFLGEEIVIAHNCTFDMGMIYVELARIEREFKFPWPSTWICTVEKSFPIKNKRLKLGDLHMIATGQPHSDKAHRALEDVYAMIRCYSWMQKQNLV